MKRALLIGLAALFVVAIALPASALGPETFSSFTQESPLTTANAQANNWRYTPDQGFRDVGIVEDGIDGNSLRMSNAVTDSSFGNWLFSEKLPNGGVTEDLNGNEFVAEFQIKTMTEAYQPGLQISVAPQSGSYNGEGARMSFLRFQDDVEGIDAYFVDYTNGGTAQRLVKIADDLDRADVHNVKIVLDLYTGTSNDVAQVFIDDPLMTNPRIPMSATLAGGWYAPVDHPDTVNKVKAGQSVPMKWKIDATPATTWEDYYRFQGESNAGIDEAEWTTRPVDSLIFQARSGAGTAPATLNGGFLFDNVELTSSETATLPTGAPGDASMYTEPIFTAYRVNCDPDADMDLLEQVATPGASHLTYNEDTGVWHYNWQTTNTQKNTCVKLVLNLTGDYALFKIVK